MPSIYKSDDPSFLSALGRLVDEDITRAIRDLFEKYDPIPSPEISHLIMSAALYIEAETRILLGIKRRKEKKVLEAPGV